MMQMNLLVKCGLEIKWKEQKNKYNRNDLITIRH